MDTLVSFIGGLARLLHSEAVAASTITSSLPHHLATKAADALQKAPLSRR